MDYELVKVDDEYQVWSPDFPAGACLGSGKTEGEAKLNAVSNMLELIKQLS